MGTRNHIVLKGKEFPLYQTKRGMFDFEQAGFSLKGIAESRLSDLQAYVFYTAKACAVREKINFPYRRLDEFVDDEEVDIDAIGKAFIAMTDQNKKQEEEEPGEAQPAKEPA